MAEVEESAATEIEPETEEVDGILLGFTVAEITKDDQTKVVAPFAEVRCMGNLDGAGMCGAELQIALPYELPEANAQDPELLFELAAECPHCTAKIAASSPGVRVVVPLAILTGGQVAGTIGAGEAEADEPADHAPTVDGP